MATIQDIAKAAGVSTATVSHVVNHTRYVSPELVARVEEAIQKCGEPPKFVKRKREKEKKRMREGGRNIYALISDITNPMYIAVSEKLRQIFEAKGYPVIILDMAGISKAETNDECNMNMQLLTTSHDLLLLDTKYLFRKDQIYFTYKDKNEVLLYSLNSFKDNKDKGIRNNALKSYLKGYFGALPNPDLYNIFYEE